MRGISRIESKNTFGWYVRVYRSGDVHAKFFSDSRYGGKAAALEAAQSYHAEYEKKHPPAPPQQKFFRQKPQKNNSTGILGVSETFKRRRNGTIVPYFCVSWQPKKGVSRSKMFSIDKYGREEAFKIAVQFRKEKEREMLEHRTE